MTSTKNTILISGGSAGIGFEIAKLLTERGDHVIITGRNQERLEAAAKRLNNVTALLFDVTQEKEVNQLAGKLNADFPKLNMLINNAGLGNVHSITGGQQAWKKAEEEMNTNYISVLRLTEKLLPQLLTQEKAVIVNVTSVLAIAPNLNIPTYSASKAALHSYTESLRLALKDTNIKVFELMPPLVNTEFSKEIGGQENGISPVQVAKDLIAAFEQDNYEVHVGDTASVFELARTSPTAALHAVNHIQ